MAWWHKEHAAELVVKDCEECGTSFTAAPNIGVRAKFCSPPCRAAGWEVTRRRSWLKRYYGISLERYDELLAKQRGGCAICGTTDTAPHQYLSVDHDHATGKARALLCNCCNVGLGRFGDDLGLLRRAVGYLEAHA